MAEAKTRVTTGKVLFSYAHVFTPTAIEGGEPKYNTSVIIKKSDKANLAIVRNAIKAATDKAVKEKYAGKLPKKWKDPLRDGDEEDKGEEYEGCYFFAATSKRRPKVVDREFNEILDPEDFYSGCFGRVCLNFYAFDVAGNKGIAAGLESIMKLSDGEPLGGGGGNVREDFGGDGFDDEDDLM
jgi:Protein of unknown function (DUF2815).